MNQTQPLKHFFKCLGFLATMAVACASEASNETPVNAVPKQHTVEQKALLQALDDQLTRFAVLQAKDGSTAHAAKIKATLTALRQRRDAFNRVAFDPGKYDELRFDLNVAYQRLNLWLAPPSSPKAAPPRKAVDPDQNRP